MRLDTGIQARAHISRRNGESAKIQTRNNKAIRPHKAVKDHAQQQPATPMDVLLRDCQYLHERTGVDLISTLAPVRDVHDQVMLESEPFQQAKPHSI